MQIKGFYDPQTSTLTYVVFDPSTLDAVVVDSVLDYDPAAGSISCEALKPVLDFLAQKELRLRMILETHVHADHVTGAQMLRERFPDAPVAIGERVTEVQKVGRDLFGLNQDFPIDGRQFNRLLRDNETVTAGSLTFRVLNTPGHTPACCCYQFGDALFTGDLLFMPDGGTGRCDFPGGSAAELYRSITNRVYRLPPATRIFTGHDYQPGGRPLAFESTVGDEMKNSIHLKAVTAEADFVAFRTARDATLSTPKLMFPSLQINIDGGRLPPTSANGRRYLKIPLTGDVKGP